MDLSARQFLRSGQTPHRRSPIIARVWTRVHCSYHKCLTVFANRCFMHVLGDDYRHFERDLQAFHAEHHRYALSATTDCIPDLSRLGDYRISRFIRDPRDLIVSGYLYHRKGVEHWTTTPWKNPVRIQGMRAGEHYAACLQRLDQDEGLIAEMGFREPHFRTMLDWPADDPRVRVWKYEAILGDEVRAMDEVGAHYGWSDERRQALREQAGRWRAGEGRLSWDAHVRDPRPGQWRDLFTPRVDRAFREQFGDLPERLGYD
jgi:hypothetical protein